MERSLHDKCSGLNKSEFDFYLERVDKTILGEISKIPKKKNSAEFLNIYLSCLLTFTDLITPLTIDCERANSLKRSVQIQDNFRQSLYKIPKNYKPILFHLDESFNDYILLLVKKIRIQMRNDLKNLLYPNFPSSILYADVSEQFKEENDN